MRLSLPLDFSNVEELKDFIRYVSPALKDIIALVNGNLAFGENIKTSRVSATFDSANSTVAVSHGLNATPNGYIVVKANAGITVFDGSNANNATTLYVQATGAGTVGLLVF